MKYKGFAILLCVLLAFAGCRPKGILSSRQMRNVLYDLHRADAILQVAGLHYGHDEELAKYYQVVLDKHHVTKAEFDSSLVWYTDHPQLFNKIYPKIMARCQAESAYWEEYDKQLASVNGVIRDLAPLDEVKHRVQHGWNTELYLGEEPQQPLLLPISLSDSVSVAAKEKVESPEDEPKTQMDEQAIPDQPESAFVRKGKNLLNNRMRKVSDSHAPERR